MATNPVNPKKKHRKMNKRKLQLDSRIKDYEVTISKLTLEERNAYKKPGSLSGRK